MYSEEEGTKATSSRSPLQQSSQLSKSTTPTTNHNESRKHMSFKSIIKDIDSFFSKFFSHTSEAQKVFVLPGTKPSRAGARTGGRMRKRIISGVYPARGVNFLCTGPISDPGPVTDFVTSTGWGKCDPHHSLDT
jgi:hypothetical protein